MFISGGCCYVVVLLTASAVTLDHIFATFLFKVLYISEPQ